MISGQYLDDDLRERFVSGLRPAAVQCRLLLEMDLNFLWACACLNFATREGRGNLDEKITQKK